MVRPWKERLRVRMVLLPLPYLSKLYFRATLIMASLDSAPELPKKTLDMPLRVHSSLASRAPGWV